MAYTTFPTDVQGPIFPVEGNYEPRVKTVDFGDGYTQEIPDGINYMQVSWSLQWEYLSPEDFEDIMDFLSDRKGAETFQWTDPSSVLHLVKCKKWTGGPTDPSLYRISAEFKKVYI